MTIRQPFDLALSLENGTGLPLAKSGGRRRPPTGLGRPAGPVATEWRGLDSGVLGEHLVHLRQTDEGLEYRVGGGHGERDDMNLDRRLRDYFRLDDELGEVYAQFGRHRAVAWSIGRHPGLRLLRQEPWECLVSHLCSGTSSIRVIKHCVEKIAQLSRRKVRLDGDERYVFPGPVQIAEAGRRTLEELGLSSRSRNIFLMALHLSHGPLLLERTADPEVSGREAVTLLDSCRGIGPRTAGCVALMFLEKLDAFPVDAAGPGPVRSGGDAGKVGGEGTEPPNPDRSAAVPGGGVGPGVFRRVRRLRQPVPVPLGGTPQRASWPERDLSPLRARSDR